MATQKSPTALRIKQLRPKANVGLMVARQSVVLVKRYCQYCSKCAVTVQLVYGHTRLYTCLRTCLSPHVYTCLSPHVYALVHTHVHTHVYTQAGGGGSVELGSRMPPLVMSEFLPLDGSAEGLSCVDSRRHTQPTQCCGTVQLLCSPPAVTV